MGGGYGTTTWSKYHGEESTTDVSIRSSTNDSSFATVELSSTDIARDRANYVGRAMTSYVQESLSYFFKSKYNWGTRAKSQKKNYPNLLTPHASSNINTTLQKPNGTTKYVQSCDHWNNIKVKFPDYFRYFLKSSWHVWPTLWGFHEGAKKTWICYLYFNKKYHDFFPD